MAGQVLLINPRKRRRSKRRHARKRSRARRPMTALQMKYFGGGRKHRSGSRKRRSAIYTNSRKRGRRGQRGFALASRGARLPRIGFNFGAIQSAAKAAAIGAGGALAVDVLMGQAGRILPDTWMSRFNVDGSINWPYYLAKAGIAVGVGVLGSRFAPRFGSTAQQMALGSFTVMSYELLRSFVPPDMITLGYYSPARVLRNGANGNGARRLGYYEAAPGSPMSPRFGTSLARLRGIGSVRIGNVGRTR